MMLLRTTLQFQPRHSSTRILSTTRFTHSISPKSNQKPIQITSPIFYVNAVPHIGHLYSAVLADTLKRWYEFKGHKAIYSTGTDEHGLKVGAYSRGSKEGKQDPKLFCDGISEKFKELFDAANVGYTRFIRTTDPDHYVPWKRFGCVVNIEQVTDPKTNASIHVSKETGKVVEWTVEENYKFRLGSVRAQLVEWLEANPDAILPKAQYMNVLTMLKQPASETDGLSDISVSRPRSRLQWGIPVPGETHTWSQEKSAWPAQWHIVGKDIIKFHAIYWPAFLIAAGLPLPKQIVSHAHWLQGKTKMSKSLGNVTDPHELMKVFGVDPVRYFLMRDGGIEHDAEFSSEIVSKRYRELANQLGNLALRCSGVKVNSQQCVPVAPGVEGFGDSEKELVGLLTGIRDEVTLRMENAQYSRGLESVIAVVSEANRYWDHQKPWILADKASEGDLQAKEQLQTALYVCFETIRITGLLLQPVMPEKMGKLLDWLGVSTAERGWNQTVFRNSHTSGTALSKLEALFPSLRKSN
ncbi:hypothetical protein BCR33DRAFT_714391 [Rhizoclosmatium globosum]|uniref:methionine--tRNA ligase n=1 Tax=Rhizoclosmatium globosum TaxID=329046 RepID=A0A1Y2CNX4_9FUNG|nr:hypothetical protein BCR33DRAFT_714391 [Rhizoclosmatium globosum]|eukprot:ORY48656.1 hypothetical protein BCR33DRAFT_714391 [Rhizoclosmatium globosum]